MFLQSPGCVTTTESGTVHHVYTHPWLAPQTFVGGGGTKWWRLEEETDTLLRNDDRVLVAMRRLTMIHRKYTVHYEYFRTPPHHSGSQKTILAGGRARRHRHQTSTP